MNAREERLENPSSGARSRAHPRSRLGLAWADGRRGCWHADKTGARVLLARQVQEPLDVMVDGDRVRDYPRDWPQVSSLRGRPGLKVRDASPFLVSFIHHSLTHIVEENRVPLGSSRQDVRAAREMRQWAVSFLSRFEYPAGAPAAFPTGMVLEALARTALASR